MKPRLLTLADIPAAVNLSTEAGWNQTKEDWRLLIELCPDTCFGLEIDGELASTTTLMTYESRLGWIGMVLTKKRFQRRGFARLLLRHAISQADARGIATLKLDATDMGAPLYASLGFDEEQTAERWFRDVPRAEVATVVLQNSRIPTELDARAFGADRSALLGRLSGSGHLTMSSNAYALSRAGRVAGYLGPCVAGSQTAAEFVIEQELRKGGVHFWDLLPGNEATLRLARKFGFTQLRRLKRMTRGRELANQTDEVFALAGFELG